MNEKDIIRKGNLNKRNQENCNIIDNLLVDKNIIEIKKKYHEELKDYDYISSLSWFSSLELKGSMRYVNKYDHELRYGGLLIKIVNNNNKWIAKIKKPDNKIYNVSYNNNYIFYNNTRTNLIDWAECFISNVDKDLYIIN
jgi:hypothetical protein